MEQNGVTATPVMESGKQSDGKGWKIATVIASVVAVCGIGFGVYGMVQSLQKDKQVSDLKNSLDNKTTIIMELETKISDFDNRIEEVATDTETTEVAPDTDQSVSKNDTGTATILLGTVLDKNDSRTVFKVGDCTADGPSVKCPVTVDGKDALLSYNDNDSILRLSLPNN